MTPIFRSALQPKPPCVGTVDTGGVFLVALHCCERQEKLYMEEGMFPTTPGALSILSLIDYVQIAE